MKALILKLWDFAKRNLLVTGLLILSIYLLAFQYDVAKLLLFITALESLALSLSGLALYAYTKVDFIETEKEHIISSVFLGVHILIGLVAMGFYLAQFIPIGSK